jgi:heptosyltransferase-2
MKDRHFYKIQNLKFENQNEAPRAEARGFWSGILSGAHIIHALSRTTIFCPAGSRFAGKGAVLAPSKYKFQFQNTRRSLFLTPGDERYVSSLLKENNINDSDKIIIVAPGARSSTKRWAKEKFSDLISVLIGEFKVKVILVGDRDDAPINKYIAQHSQREVIDLAGKTSIRQLAGLMKKSMLLITNDSATMHLASYIGLPVVAIFGPTDDTKYGPWSGLCTVVKKEIFCRPCEKAQCKFGALDCLHLIKVEDALRQVKDILALDSKLLAQFKRDNFKRILIVRTDRIGDVLLSTPLIKAIRDDCPNAFIAMMVSPYAKDIVDGNPYLDQVIIYDKEGKHKSWHRSMKFARNLKKKRFDLAIILHPNKRVHLVTFFAGISKRVGYDRKMGFLLTDRIIHAKQFGEKHELEYNLDLLRYLGIEVKEKSLFMPIKAESERWIEELFKQEGIREGEKLLTIHPGASCPSKIWPEARFAEAADKLAGKYGFKIFIVAGPKDISRAEMVSKTMHSPAINLAGKTSVSQLASLLNRCRLFISNDSGPVHIASAVGTPVISIFGRNQKGLSPTRWGPVGPKDKILHKEVGCIKCLAHNCKKGFACLKAINVEDVLSSADSILALA